LTPSKTRRGFIPNAKKGASAERCEKIGNQGRGGSKRADGQDVKPTDLYGPMGIQRTISLEGEVRSLKEES